MGWVCCFAQRDGVLLPTVPIPIGNASASRYSCIHVPAPAAHSGSSVLIASVFFIPCTSAGVPVLPARCFFGTRKFNDVFWFHFRPISFLRLILIVRGLFFALACILTERRIGAAKTRNKKLTTPGALVPTIRRSLPPTYHSTTRYRCSRNRKFSWNLYRCAARVVIAKSAWELQWCSSTRPARATATPLVFTLVSSPLHSMEFYRCFKHW